MSSNIVQANKLLAKTINVGLHLGISADDGWCIEVTDEVLRRIQKAGFSAIRLGVQWAAHCQREPAYAIDEEVFAKVDAVVAGAMKYGLAVVVCNFLDPELMRDPSVHKRRFLEITRQVSARYKGAANSVMLELLAEPREKLDAFWNEYLATSLAIVREDNPDRAIIVGPCAFNNIRKLKDLQLPDADRNLIVTVHHYWPLKFTMQGEAWFHLPWFMTLFLGNPKSWPGTTWEGTKRQQDTQRRIFEKVDTWAKAHDRPLFVGEFGSGNSADMPSRVRWASFVRALSEARGFSWGYWSYGPSFALYDFERKQWHKELLEALIK